MDFDINVLTWTHHALMTGLKMIRFDLRLSLLTFLKIQQQINWRDIVRMDEDRFGSQCYRDQL
jgi:hypothetical protein